MPQNHGLMRVPFILIALAIAGAPAVLRAEDEPLASDLVQATLISEVGAVKPNVPFTVAVRLKIAPHWHLYWINPGDAGLPTTVKFDLPEGFTASPIKYPTPHRFEDTGGIVMFGYADEVMLLATITPPATLSGESISIGATVKYLVCEKSCIPGEAKVTLALPTREDGKPSASNEISIWKKRLPVSITEFRAISGQKLKFSRSSARKNEGEIQLTIEWKDTVPDKLVWYPPPSDAVVFSEIRTTTRDKVTTITAKVQHLIGQKLDAAPIDSVLGYDAADGHVGVAIPVNFPSEFGS